MKLTRSLLCLSVLAALSISSCTNSGGSGDFNFQKLGNSPIHAHRIGLITPNAPDSYGGYGGGYNGGYAFYPMPTEKYGDYFNPANDLSLVGNSWERYNTVFTNYSQTAVSQTVQAAPMTSGK